MYFYLYDDPLSMALYFLGIAIMIGSFVIQAKVKSTFKKYNNARTARGITGAQAARMVLEQNGVYGCRISMTSGELTDHYDPRANEIRLSEAVYNSTGVAAIGVAAHEAGHAVQYAEHYTPIKVRTTVLPVAQLGSTAALPITLLGFVFSFKPVIYLGILLFAAVTLFQLITLPVELNASKRAMAAIRSSAMLSNEEATGAKKVLTVAALTYIAALAASVVNLLRLIAMVSRRND